MMVEFHNGALADSYEEQANAQGLTFGENKDFVESLGYGLVAAHIHDVLTDKEFDKAIERFQKKVLIKMLKPLQ